MQAQDVILTARDLQGEPLNTGRWDDATMLRHTNSASQQMMLETEWPEATLTMATNPGGAPTAEYQLPPMIKLLRVFVSGRLCPPTSIPIMVGEQSGIYDDTGTNFQTQWQAAPAVVYPQGGGGAGQYNTVSTFSPGKRPKYYTRGGFLGLVPTPSTSVPITIDCVLAPNKVVDLTDVLVWPDFFRDGMAYKVCEYMSRGDGDNETANVFLMEYRNEYLPTLRTWAKNWDGKPQGIIRRNPPRRFSRWFGGSSDPAGVCE